MGKFRIILPDAEPFKTMSIYSENKHYYAYHRNDIVEIDLSEVLGGEDLSHALTLLMNKALKERGKIKTQNSANKHV